MKKIKMLGLTVVAALTAMALVGVSSAMAESTALCSEDASPCPAGKLVSHVHEVTSGHAKLLTSITTVECNVLFLGDVSTKGLLGNPLAISGNFTYTNCLNGCQATELNGPTTITVLKEGVELSKVTGEGLVLVNCSLFGLHCTYVGTGLVGHGLGPLLTAKEEPKGAVNGEVRTEGVETKKDPKDELSFCPSTSKLDILVAPLTATYISS